MAGSRPLDGMTRDARLEPQKSVVDAAHVVDGVRMRGSELKQGRLHFGDERALVALHGLKSTLSLAAGRLEVADGRDRPIERGLPFPKVQPIGDRCPVAVHRCVEGRPRPDRDIRIDQCEEHIDLARGRA